MTTIDTTPAAGIIARAQAAKELAEKATPGPWFHAYGPDGDESGIYPDPVGTREIYQRHACGDEYLMECATEDDAEFIAASRSLVPALAAAVVTLAEALAWYADETKHEDTGPIGNRLDYGGKGQDALARAAEQMEGK